MHRMRRYLVAVAALILGMNAALTLPVQGGVTPDPSTHCSDGISGGPEHPILTTPVTIAYELGAPTGPAGAPTYVQVCYSTTSVGDGSPTPAGGKVIIHFPWSADTPGVYCRSDAGAVVKPNCDTYESLIAQDPNPSSTGQTVSGQIVTPAGTVNVFQTGAEAGNVTTPGGGATSTAGLGNTCLWVLGTQQLPTCTSVVGATVSNADLPQVYGGICAVQQGNTCVVGAPGVQVGGDTSNPTVNVDTPLGPVPVNVPCVRAIQTGAVVVLC